VISVKPRRHLLAAAGLAIAGLLAVGLLVRGAGSVPGWIASRYTHVSGGGSSAVYASTSPPLTVADEIGRRWKPFDRAVTPSGTFLRYDDLIVAVLAAQGGSRIHLDPERDGYRRWYGVLGGRWGTAAGAGERWRGGGPGVGK
jgi:Domain of unknown function (DUF4247)